MFRGDWSDFYDTHTVELTERGEFSVYTARVEPDKEQVVLFLHHGAGYSALSFATLVGELCELSRDTAIVALDARAHGSSLGEESELSLENLCADFVAIIQSFKRQWTVPHQIFLAGHSLGGSIVTWIARKELVPDILGIIIIDIVEETALRALQLMPRLLEDRPKSFPSLEDGVKWAIKTKTSRNLKSASISIPDQLKFSNEPAFINDKYSWKVNLIKSQPHWDGWFRGLSTAFIQCNLPKVLILAEREYLDRTLMIASMQGKFQCCILRDTGHAIQEDIPDKLAKVIATFIERNLKVAKLNQGNSIVHR